MSGLEGRISLDFVPRWLEGTDFEDQDLYTTVLLRWGGPSDRRSGSIYWRGVRDLDGAPPGIPSDDPFRSSYDYLGSDPSSHVYHLYYDLRGSPGGSFVRLGRQFVYEGQPFHFDGGRFDTKAGRGGLKASVFGGRPVRSYEADIDRTRCYACHVQDECVRCHTNEAPAISPVCGPPLASGSCSGTGSAPGCHWPALRGVRPAIGHTVLTDNCRLCHR